MLAIQQNLLKRLIMICNVIKLNYFIKNMILSIFNKIFFKKINIQDINKILIFRVGELGDNICAIPAINIIKNNFLDSKIEILTSVGEKNTISFESLLKGGIVDKYIDYTNIEKKDLFKLIKYKKYDLIIQLPQNMATLYQQLRDMLFFKLCRIPYGFGWKINSDLFLRKYQDKCINKNSENEVDRLITNLIDNGLIKYDKKYPLNIKKKDMDAVQNKLVINEITDKNKNISLVIGAKIYPKEWGINNFKIISNYFISLGYNILLIGGKEDKGKAEYLLDKCKGSIYNFCGIFTPIQSILMLQNSRLTLTNDTGPMHMSVSVNTPVVALFSSWSYDKKWFPDNSNSIVIRKELECSICYDRSCSNNICMQNISTNEVIEAMEQLLKRQDAPCVRIPVRSVI
jgi:ADP-heptose:LPS heptosyltransferase